MSFTIDQNSSASDTVHAHSSRVSTNLILYFFEGGLILYFASACYRLCSRNDGYLFSFYFFRDKYIYPQPNVPNFYPRDLLHLLITDIFLNSFFIWQIIKRRLLVNQFPPLQLKFFISIHFKSYLHCTIFLSPRIYI
jgi:hypothetical protein